MKNQDNQTNWIHQTKRNKELIDSYTEGVEEMQKAGLNPRAVEGLIQSQVDKEKYAEYLVNLAAGSAHGLEEMLNPEGYMHGHFDDEGNYYMRSQDGGSLTITKEGYILEK